MMRRNGLRGLEFYRSGKLNKVLFVLGLIAVCVMAVPYAIMGQDSVVVCHDQLDGELIAYILQAKHLFTGSTLPEFMSGAAKTSLIPPAPAAVFLFKIFTPFTSLIILQMAGSIVGYIGMYILSHHVTGNSVVSAVVGVMYGYLPFLPVYGLSQYGIPLLIFLIINVAEKRNLKAVVPAVLYGIFYGMNSSLVLVGFGILGSLALVLIWMGLRSKKYKSGKRFLSVLSVWVALLVTYVIENFSLLMQTFSGLAGTSEIPVSHKTEYTLIADRYVYGFVDAFINGGQHSEDFHKYFLWFIIASAVCGLFLHIRRRTSCTGLYKILWICIAANIFYSAAAALWNGKIGVLLRENFGVFGSFQLDRLLWISPCLWYLAFACSLHFVMSAAMSLMDGKAGESSAEKKQSKVIKYTAAAALYLLSAVVAAICGIIIFFNSNIKPNIRKLMNPDYNVMSFNDYYAVGVMKQVEEYIRQQTGKTVDEYRVVSLGIDPAAAIYQGFYCIDGYSNNYSLDYKHRFREIIAPELAKSEYLTQYFDGWGNRCYLFSAECPGYYMIQRGGFYFQDYSVNTDALKNLGAEYILSAAYIADAEATGLTLMNEEPFETEDSYYQIYVYAVE
jgi:hypothetical protein